MSRWHPREHRKALDGMLSLTLEERGAYNTCLDLIYDREGPIPDDPRWLAGWMGVTPRKWATIRAALIVKGKLYPLESLGVAALMNERAAIELEILSEKSRELAENGAKGGRQSAERRAKDSKNNDKVEAPVKLSTVTVTATEEEPTTINASKPAWKSMLEEAKAAAGDAADLTRTAMHHAADLRALVEPRSGEPCTWAEVVTAIEMTAIRQRAKGKMILSWSWVRDDALALRDKRLNAVNPEVADSAPLRATGPPNSITDKIAADNAEARRRAFETMDAQDGRTN